MNDRCDCGAYMGGGKKKKKKRNAHASGPVTGAGRVGQSQ